MKYTLIRTDRRTLNLHIKEGVIIVRAPRKAPQELIDNFLEKHKSWIEKALLKDAKKQARFRNLTEENIARLKSEAKDYFKSKTDEYSKLMDIKYGRITITSAKTRFGSCSSRGNISYSYTLMLYPEYAREYVIVHELAHILEMNHSKKFYKIISDFMPDYKERRSRLED